MFFRTSIKQQPCDEPDETDRAGDDERGAPAPFDSNELYDEWRDERTDVRAGVQDAGRERALFLRKPLSYSLDRRRKVSRLPKAEKETRHTEAKHRARQRVAHCCRAP